MKLLQRTATALALFGAALAAQADTVTYDFSLTVTDGSLARLTDYTGSLSYDTSIVPSAGGQVDGTSLLQAFDLLFGVQYSTANTFSGYLAFDPTTKELTDLVIGTHCAVSTSGGDCDIAGAPDWRMWWSTSGSSFIYADESGNHFGSISAFTLRDTTGGSVPEPASMALVLSAALLAYGSTRRRS